MRLFHERVDNVLNCSAEVADSDSRKKPRLKAKFLPNRDNLQALDHAVQQGVHKDGLRIFLPARRPRPLAHGEELVLLPADDLPPEAQLPDRKVGHGLFWSSGWGPGVKHPPQKTNSSGTVRRYGFVRLAWPYGVLVRIRLSSEA